MLGVSLIDASRQLLTSVTAAMEVMNAPKAARRQAEPKIEAE